MKLAKHLMLTGLLTLSLPISNANAQSSCTRVGPASTGYVDDAHLFENTLFQVRQCQYIQNCAILEVISPGNDGSLATNDDSSQVYFLPFDVTKLRAIAQDKIVVNTPASVELVQLSPSGGIFAPTTLQNSIDEVSVSAEGVLTLKRSGANMSMFYYCDINKIGGPGSCTSINMYGLGFPHGISASSAALYENFGAGFTYAGALGIAVSEAAYGSTTSSRISAAISGSPSVQVFPWLSPGAAFEDFYQGTALVQALDDGKRNCAHVILGAWNNAFDAITAGPNQYVDSCQQIAGSLATVGYIRPNSPNQANELIQFRSGINLPTANINLSALANQTGEILGFYNNNSEILTSPITSGLHAGKYNVMLPMLNTTTGTRSLVLYHCQ